jgi:DNA-binding transcriptional LysR family regulator
VRDPAAAFPLPSARDDATDRSAQPTALCRRQRDRLAGTGLIDMLTVAKSDTVVEQIRRGHADLGFAEGPASPKGLRSCVIGHDELVVVLRPDHPWAQRRRPVTAAELVGTRLVSREQGSGTREVLAAALSAALGPRVTLPVDLALSSTARSGRRYLPVPDLPCPATGRRRGPRVAPTGLAGVPASQRCTGHAPGPGEGGGWLRRLIGCS